jgi:hypothetical protein
MNRWQKVRLSTTREMVIGSKFGYAAGFGVTGASCAHRLEGNDCD